jgi:ABC-type transporter Mla MlaB component
MLKIMRVTKEKEEVVFAVSGRLDAGNLVELESLFSSEMSGLPKTLDLRELTQVDQVTVSFLMHCESDGIQLKNCPAYVREWVTRERRQS